MGPPRAEKTLAVRNGVVHPPDRRLDGLIDRLFSPGGHQPQSSSPPFTESVFCPPSLLRKALASERASHFPLIEKCGSTFGLSRDRGRALRVFFLVRLGAVHFKEATAAVPPCFPPQSSMTRMTFVPGFVRIFT